MTYTENETKWITPKMIAEKAKLCRGHHVESRASRSDPTLIKCARCGAFKNPSPEMVASWGWPVEV